MFDRMYEGLAAMIRGELARVDYLALYPARVVSQAGDGRLELETDDARIGTVNPVPVRLGLPGVAVKVAPGSRVLLGFENGDPRKPVATLWEVSSLLEIAVSASVKVTVDAPLVEIAGGSTPVARHGDTVSGTITGTSVSGGAVSGTFTGTVTASTVKLVSG